MLFEMAKSVKIVINLGKNTYFALKFFISCKSTVPLPPVCPHKGPVKLIQQLKIALFTVLCQICSTLSFDACIYTYGYQRLFRSPLLNIGILRMTGEVSDRFNEITLFEMALFW